MRAGQQADPAAGAQRRRGGRGRFGDRRVRLGQHGVEIVAEKVESERQIVDLLDLEISFGQGHLFGEPRAIRDAVLAESEPPADFMRAQMRRAAGAY